MKRFFPVSLFLVLALFLSSCGSDASVENTPSHLNSPLSAEDYKGQHYQAVIDDLQNAGFYNIESTVLEDLTSNNSQIDGSIESISINGVDSFEANDEFPLGSQVLITYHIIPKLSSPISESDLQNLSYSEIGQAFTDAGFTNVSIKDEYDLDPDTISVDFLNEVSIRGRTSFALGDEIPFDASITVICHYPYKKYTLNLSIDFIGNLIFNKYDIIFEVDRSRKGTLPHGTDAEYELRLKEGSHTLSFKNIEDSDVTGEIALDVTCDIDASYKINCYNDKVGITEVFVDRKRELAEDEAKLPGTRYDFIGENYKDVVNTLESLGFTDIVTIPEYDIFFGITENESVSNVVIGNSDEYKRGDIFKKNITVTVTYHMPYEDDPARATHTPNVLEPDHSNSVDYSTNDLETAKAGNSGVFAYKNIGGSYDIYYIIDFDEGYVYYFLDGNGDTSGDRLKIDSGDLNSVLIITYHDGSDIWSYGLHFKWKNQPDHLIVEGDDGFESDYYTTNLDDALTIRNSKSIKDY